jgi:hypothetical protein
VCQWLLDPFDEDEVDDELLELVEDEFDEEFEELVEVDEPPVDVEVDEPPVDVDVEDPPVEVEVEPPDEDELDDEISMLMPLEPLLELEPPKKPPAKKPPMKPPLPEPPITPPDEEDEPLLLDDTTGISPP